MNDKELEVPETNYDKKFLKPRSNGLLLSDEQLEILKRHEIDYNNCFSVTELLYKIDNILLNTEDYELEMVAIDISERNYYMNTNK